MGREDDVGLAWSGRPPPRRAGGFVDGVGLNERTHELALDPEGVVSVAPTQGGGRAGPSLDVEVLDDAPAERTQPNGRVRLS